MIWLIEILPSYEDNVTNKNIDNVDFIVKLKPNVNFSIYDVICRNSIDYRGYKVYAKILSKLTKNGIEQLYIDDSNMDKFLEIYDSETNEFLIQKLNENLTISSNLIYNLPSYAYDNVINRKNYWRGNELNDLLSVTNKKITIKKRNDDACNTTFYTYVFIIIFVMCILFFMNFLTGLSSSDFSLVLSRLNLFISNILIFNIFIKY